MKQYRFFSLCLGLVLCSLSAFAADVQELQAQQFVIHQETETIAITNKNFEMFLSGIVQEALEDNSQAILSEALLRCYACMKDEQKECFIKDLQEAIPELMTLAHAYCKEMEERAPRPGITPENGIAGPGNCDLSSVMQLLQQVATALNRCCNILQQDFRETWTILTNINCGDSSATLSILTDLKATLSTDFNQTWTILAAGFNGTFTAINAINSTNFSYSVITDLKATLSTDFNQTWTILSDIKNTLTACCENIQNNFNGTFTAIESLIAPCAATPILAPTIISAPGYYCLANDIVGTVTITATNVTFDLNNHTISAPGTTAILLSGAVNVIIENGKIDNAAIGLEVNLSTTNIIRNLKIIDCSSAAIQLDFTSATRPNSNIFENLVIDSCPLAGIFAPANISDSQFKNIFINNTQNPVLVSSRSNLFENIQIIDCYGSTAFSINSGFSNKISDCSIINFSGTNGARGFSISSDDTILENCTVQNIFNLTSGIGVIALQALNPTIILKNCSAINVQSDVGSIGFLIAQDNTTLENCLVQTCSSLSNFNQNYGFVAQNDISFCNFINCMAYGSAGFGFNLLVPNSNNNTFKLCEAANNSLDGFQFNDIDTLVSDCIAYRNGGRGFNVAAVGTIPMYGCFASGNTVANYVNAPNVVAAATATRFNNSFI